MYEKFYGLRERPFELTPHSHYHYPSRVLEDALAHLQLGLESTHKPGVTLANYQESKVRWLHVKLEQWLNGGD